jgi:hypothetical protein
VLVRANHVAIGLQPIGRWRSFSHLRHRSPHSKPHLVLTRGTEVDPDVGVTSHWKPFNAHDFDVLPASACWPFGAARL